MPAVKAGKLEQRNRVIKSCIVRGMELYGIDDKNLAMRLRCAERTFREKRKNDPGSFKLKELWILADTLKFTEEERDAILK